MPSKLELSHAVRVVVCNPGLAPWVLTDVHSNVTGGTDLELIRDLLSSLNASWTVEALSEEEALRRIDNVEADVYLCGHFPTADGASKGDYTMPYEHLHAVLVQRSEDQLLGIGRILKMIFTARSSFFLVAFILLAAVLGTTVHHIERFRGPSCQNLSALLRGGPGRVLSQRRH
jgi:hypothetical protein